MEQAKKLIALARNELKVFGTDSVKLQSHALDKVGESFMLRVDKRKEELNAALEFYNLVKKVRKEIFSMLKLSFFKRFKKCNRTII